MAEEPNRAVAVIDGALGETLLGYLSDVALRPAQHRRPLRYQHCGRKRDVPGALQADEFSHVLQILTEDVLITFREHRHGTRPETEKPISSCEVVQDINCEEANAFFRKKLLRSQATASAGLGEQDEAVIGGLHCEING